MEVGLGWVWDVYTVFLLPNHTGRISLEEQCICGLNSHVKRRVREWLLKNTSYHSQDILNKNAHTYPRLRAGLRSIIIYGNTSKTVIPKNIRQSRYHWKMITG